MAEKESKETKESKESKESDKPVEEQDQDVVRAEQSAEVLNKQTEEFAKADEAWEEAKPEAQKEAEAEAEKDNK
jgi:hypothetical protein